jgi:enoyl-CoA hydratase
VTVTVSRAGAVATVVVDHPPVNALGDEVLEGLVAAFHALGDDDGVRVVKVAAAGERSFIAGADLGTLRHSLGDRQAMEAHVGLTERMFGALDALPVPSIAVVTGHAVGGGLEVALACDLIVADPRARIGLPEVTLGLIPGAGGTQRLPRRAGSGLATRMLLTGELLRADEAASVGLVDVLAEAGQAAAKADELAERIAALPRRAVRAAKAAVRAASELPLRQGLLAERQLFLDTAEGADALEGASAFLEERPPLFGHA